jgi:hypothetical protein
MNRNRILHPTQGWQYISIPVHRGSHDATIKDVMLVDREAAHRRIMGQIEHYRHNRAPHFTRVARLVDTAFASAASGLLRDLNTGALRAVCDYLGIHGDWQNWSDSRVALPPIRHAGQWAVEISVALGASDYINPESGRKIFNPEEFHARGVRLHLKRFFSPTYACGPLSFVPALSIIDVLMWNSADEVRGMLAARKADAQSMISL